MDNAFPRVIQIGQSAFEFDYEHDLHINRADLDGEFCRQAEIFARYSTAYEFSVEHVGVLKLNLDRLMAHLDHQGRMEASSAGLSKFTEKMAENYVKGNASYLEAVTELLQAQRISGLLKQARDAIVQKKEM